MPEDIFDTDEIQVQADIPDNVVVNEYGSTVEIGTVTTLDYGENATVTNTGTADHAILNFGIPRGSSGAGWGILEGDIENQTDLWTILTGLRTDVDLKAPLASAALTGTPTAPTAIDGTNTDQLATTKFVQNAINLLNNSLQSYVNTYVNTAVANVLKYINFGNMVTINISSTSSAQGTYTIPSNGYIKIIESDFRGTGTSTSDKNYYIDSKEMRFINETFPIKSGSIIKTLNKSSSSGTYHIRGYFFPAVQ